MKSSKSNPKIPVATIFFEASSLRYISQRSLLAVRNCWTRSLKPFIIFAIFVKPWDYGVYGMLLFGELADNGLLSCIAVVGADS